MISKFHYEDVRLDCLEFFSTFTEFKMQGIWNGPDKALREKDGIIPIFILIHSCLFYHIKKLQYYQ